jgi:hypothetical protein
LDWFARKWEWNWKVLESDSKAAVAAGLNWKTIETMDEATLECRLLEYPRPSGIYA